MARRASDPGRALTPVPSLGLSRIQTPPEGATPGRRDEERRLGQRAGMTVARTRREDVGMAKLDVEWAIREVDEFLRTTDQVGYDNQCRDRRGVLTTESR